MGLFGRFRKDPAEELDKAAGWLESGDPVRALESARRQVGASDPGHRARALELVNAARAALVRNGVEKSAAAEAAGDLADAADWMRAALQHAGDDPERGAMKARLAALERRAAIGQRQGSRAWEAAEAPEGEEGRVETGGGEVVVRSGEARPDDARPARTEAARPEEVPDDEGAGFDDEDLGDEDLGVDDQRDDGPWLDDEGDGTDFDDPDTRYELLVDTLDDAVAERYRQRPTAFRRAYLQLNDGDVEAAVAVFDELLATAPGDAVLSLERGRARLLLGDPDGARGDLEAAWPELGDEPLDRAGSLRVPTLWAEAALAGGDAAAVAQRLDGLSALSRRDPDLAALHGRALVAEGRLDEARSLLAAAVDRFPQRPDLAQGLAEVLSLQGHRRLAIDVLETSVAPSCATGSCQAPPLHLPSLRNLVALRLALRPSGLDGGRGEGETAGTEGEEVTAADLDRVEDLMRWIAGAQGGRLAAVDHLLAARYHEVCDEPERAAEERRLAEELARREVTAVETATEPDPAAPAGRAVL